MGRISPPGKPQESGSADPTSATCKLALLYGGKAQKRVAVRSAVLHLLSSLTYKEVRGGIAVVWG